MSTSSEKTWRSAVIISRVIGMVFDYPWAAISAAFSTASSIVPTM